MRRPRDPVAAPEPIKPETPVDTPIGTDEPAEPQQDDDAAALALFESEGGVPHDR